MTPSPRFTLRGQLIDHNAQDMVSLHVEAFDFDIGRPGQSLGQTATDDAGRFELHFTSRAAGGSGEGAPEVFLIVHSADGRRLILQTNWVRVVGPVHDFGTLTTGQGESPVQSAGAPDVQGSQGAAEGSPSVTPNAAPDPLDPGSRVGSARFHGSETRDFIVPRSPFFQGAFGRLFRALPAWVPPGRTDGEKVGHVQALAATMLGSVEEAQDPARDNPDIPAAYTYFGQFVDHDLTFDPTSSLDKLNDPERLINFRTPRFDLDNLYGRGPDDVPYLYDRRPGQSGAFVLGEGRHRGPQDADDGIDMDTLQRTGETDLPRGGQGVALIGDPRNDENLIVSQVQLAFLKLHNRVLADVKASGLTGREAFTRAQTLVRWHYQWVVLFDFLRRLVGQDVLDEVLPERNGTFHPTLRFYRFKNTPFMPVEFSVAAYRFGHAAVRDRYDLNSVVRGVPIFLPPSSRPGPLHDLRGFRPLPGPWTLDWSRFVDSGAAPAQRSRRIDAKLSPALGAIPAGPGGSNALAALNLLRGLRVGLPSGQAVARAMGAPKIWTNEELGIDPEHAGTETPLWLYFLKEAGQEQHGQRLGWTGSRIVAEVFVGLAAHDPNGFLKVDPHWRPELADGGGPLMAVQGDALQLRDLLRHAGALQ